MPRGWPSNFESIPIRNKGDSFTCRKISSVRDTTVYSGTRHDQRASSWMQRRYNVGKILLERAVQESTCLNLYETVSPFLICDIIAPQGGIVLDDIVSRRKPTSSASLPRLSLSLSLLDEYTKLWTLLFLSSYRVRRIGRETSFNKISIVIIYFL